MGFLKSAKGSLISDNFMLLHDVAQFKEGNAIEVALFDDHLTLSAPFMGKAPVTLKYSQITDVFYGIETEIVQKSKSPIGRAVAGGLLFGSAGAIVGAVSGAGTKEKTVKKFLFVVSYTSADGEEKYLQFQDTRLYKGAKLAQKLKELCNIPTTAPAAAEEITEL